MNNLILSNLVIGVLTLTASLSSVFVKDYLDNKKLKKKEHKQKLLGVSLVSRLTDSLVAVDEIFSEHLLLCAIFKLYSRASLAKNFLLHKINLKNVIIIIAFY
jgi:hypothetical protein